MTAGRLNIGLSAAFVAAAHARPECRRIDTGVRNATPNLNNLPSAVRAAESP